jgi:glycosyltransferase involved in cell wall biosynthesis
MSCRLTVLMTVFNGGLFLRSAMESILGQTYSDFHFLIVDDASTDESREVVEYYQDSRIKLLSLEQNIGQTAALNVGLRHSSTPWIARMDADDISAPTRLEEQMRAVDADDSLCCLGTHAWTFQDDPDAATGELLTPSDHGDIKLQLLRGSPLIHSSMVAKRSVLLEVGAYNELYRYAADVDLYDRLLRYHPAANIPEKLYGIRVHPGQGTRSETAINEIIDILLRRLDNDEYAPWERSVIQSSLARSKVVLARHLGREGNAAGMIRNLAGSLLLSPKTFAWYFPAFFVGYSLPVGLRNALKGLVART